MYVGSGGMHKEGRTAEQHVSYENHKITLNYEILLGYVL